MFRKIWLKLNFPVSRKFSWVPPTKDTVCTDKAPPMDHQPRPSCEEFLSQEGDIEKIKPTVCPWKIAGSSPAGPSFAEQTPSTEGLWRFLTFLVALPLVAYLSVKEYYRVEEEERPEFVPYEYLTIRRKRFPWGEGNKSLFHNPKKNALPDGYEE